MINRGLDQRSEKFFKCSCELFIEDFKVNHSGYLYFLWQSDNKQTQTLKYQTIASYVNPLSQTLNLNIVLCAKNGKFLPKPTILYLLDEQGDQLDDIELNVNQWPAVFRQLSVPIGGGSMKIKVRRKQLMEVQCQESEDYDQIGLSNNNSVGRDFNTSLYRELTNTNTMGNQGSIKQASSVRRSKRNEPVEFMSARQQQPQLESNRERQRSSMYINKNNNSIISVPLHNNHSASNLHATEQLQQELAITKKQLQDNLYLNNKLKNDRDVLMKKQQSLESQIENILITTSEQVRKLRQHYDQRIGFREMIYEEEIQQMVVMINGNADYSKKVVEQILRQKSKLDEENKSLTTEMKKVKEELQEYKTKYDGQLKQLNIQLAKKIQQHQKEKAQQERKLIEETEMTKKQFQQMKNKIQQEKEQIQNELQAYKVEFEKSRMINLSLEDELVEQQKKNESKSIQVQQKVQQIQKATLNIKTLSEMLNHGEKTINQLKIQVESLKKQNNQQLLHLTTELQQKTHHINEIEGQLQELMYELEFNEDAHKQLKFQHEEKQQELYSQLQNIEAIYNDKLQQYAREMHEKTQPLANQNNQLREKLAITERRLSQIQEKLILKEEQLSQIRQGGKLGEKQLSHFKQLQQQNYQLKNQFQNRIKSMQDQWLNNNKQLQERVKMLQKQLKTLQKIKQQNQTKLRNYEKQLMEIKGSHNGYGLMNNRSGGSQTKLPETRSVKELPGLLNRSVILTQQNDNMPTQQITLGHQIQSINPKQLQLQLKQKTEQINYLINRNQQLTRLCSQLQAKFKQAQSFKLVQYCDSEKDEEQDINRDQKKKKLILEDLQIVEKEKQMERVKEIDRQRNHTQRKSNHLQKSNSQGHTHNNGGNNKNPQKTITFDELNFNRSITPKNTNYLKRKQSLGMSKQMSDYSNASYIKVSHNQKIRQQQEMIEALEEREKQYKRDIESYIKRIEDLTVEIDRIRLELQEYMGKGPVMGESVLLEMDGLKGVVTEQKSQIEKKDKLLQETKSQLQRTRQQYELTKAVNQSLEAQLRQQQKINTQLRVSMKQLQSQLSILAQSNKQLQEKNKKDELELKEKIGQLEQKLREQKEHQQQIRMQNREVMFINEQTTNEMKKYKLLAQEAEEKLRKYVGSDVTIKELNKQIDEYNKKHLEHIKTYNTLKLEKDSIEQELKIVKKKHAQQSRIAIQWEQKALGLERTIDQYKRKQAKYKRQVEEAQQDARKIRNSSKKLEEEIHTLSTLSTSFNYEKKKLMDQLAQKGDELTRKQYEANRLMKELEKYRHRIEESEDNRIGRKNELRVEIQKLQTDLIRRDKRILQQQEELKLLKGRLEFLQRENTKIVQKKTQTYGDKLKYYIDEIASIKKLLDEYQAENTKLKVQNNQFFEENEQVKLSYSKLEQKYQQSIDNEENMLMDLQHYMDQNQHLIERNRQIEIEFNNIEQLYAQCRKQLEEQYMKSKKKAERLQQLDRANSLLMEENKQLKIKLNQLQTQTQIAYNVNEKYKQLDRKKTQLEDSLKAVKYELQDHKRQFLYRQEDVQKMLQQVKLTERKQRQHQLSTTVDQLTKSHQLKTAKFQQQLLQMFSENSKLRQELSLKSDELGRVKLLLNEYQSMASKLTIYQQEIRQFKEQIVGLKEELRRKLQKQSKDQVYIKQLETKLDSKQVQSSEQYVRVNELQMRIERLNSKILELNQLLEEKERRIKQLLNELAIKQQSMSKQQQQLQINIKERKQYQKKIVLLEADLVKLKEDKSAQTIQYGNKIKSLQQKLEEMSLTMVEHQKQLELHYQEEIYLLENNINSLTQELQDKMARIDELNEAVIMIQSENQHLLQEIQRFKEKLNQETEMFTIQYNKQKQKLKDNEEIYTKNIRNLQEEMTLLGKELTQLKYAKEEKSLTSSEADEKKIARRLEEKLKTKEKKIDELKSNIYILQETVLKLRKKQSSSESLLLEVQQLRSEVSNLQSQLSEQKVLHEKQRISLQTQVQQMKEKLALVSGKEEEGRLRLEEQTLQMQSQEAELKTVRTLYGELQKELERRKLSLTAQMQEESMIAVELKSKQALIAQQRQKIQQLMGEVGTLGVQSRRLVMENKRLQERIKQALLQIETQQSARAQLEQTKQLIKSQLQTLRKINQEIETQNKSTKSECQRVKRVNEELKLQLDALTQEYEEMVASYNLSEMRMKQLQNIQQKHSQMQQITIKQLGIPLQQLILQGYFLQILQEKQHELNQYVQQLEEMKFTNDRKMIDYDMLKKENYQLIIKAEDVDILTEQVDNLRKICDKLEEEKKHAIFRQELIKMHLNNILDNSDYDQQYKLKIEHILRNVASVDQLGPISFGEASFVAN